MPNSLIFALGITLLYIVVTFNRKVYDELYLKAIKRYIAENNRMINNYRSIYNERNREDV